MSHRRVVRILSVLFPIIFFALFLSLSLVALLSDQFSFESFEGFLLSSAIIALFLAVLFLAGAILFLKNKKWGARLISLASGLFLILMAFPAYYLFQLSLGLVGILFTTVILLVIAAPFLYVILNILQNRNLKL